MIQIEKIGIDKKGYFRAISEGEEVGIISFYLKKEAIFTIAHTKVKKEFQDKNIAWKLLNQLIIYARQMNYKVIPECSYAKRMFQLKEEIRDVLSDDYQL